MINKNDVIIRLIKIIDNDYHKTDRKYDLHELNFAIKFAKDNEILLTFLNKYLGKNYKNIENVKKLKEQEYIRQKKLLSTIIEVNDIFDANNINYFYASNL